MTLSYERHVLISWTGLTLQIIKAKASENKLERFVICHSGVELLKLCFFTPQSNFPAFQNAISGFRKINNAKHELLETQASNNILPPQLHNNNLDPTHMSASEEFPQIDKSNERRNAYSDESEDTGRRMSPPPTGFEPPKLLPTYNQEFRQREEARLRQLGLPISSFVSRNQQPKPLVSQFSPQTQAPKVATASSFQSTKKPVVKTFDPEKNFKAFEHIFQPGKKATHKDYDFSRYFTKKENDQATTTTSVQRRQDVFGSTTTTRPVFSFKQATTTKRPVTIKIAPTIKQFATSKPTIITTTTTRRPPTSPTSRPQTFNQISRSSALPVRSTAAPRVSPFNQIVVSAQRAQIPPVAVPARDLEPPFDVIRNYEDATTKGPPIYYEWKIPDRALLPPKLDNETDEVQSKRSITEEGNYENNNDFQSSESRRTTGKGSSIKIQYKDLQKFFAIPEEQLPIEASGRDGYENSEAVNSFQVRIPYKNGKTDRYYYLEHAHCNPECHPYFFKPGRCEPCIKL